MIDIRLHREHQLSNINSMHGFRPSLRPEGIHALGVIVEIEEGEGIVEICLPNGEEFLLDMVEEEVLFCSSNNMGLNSNPEFNRVLIHLEEEGVNL